MSKTLILLSMMVPLSPAEMFGISDKSYPHVFLTDPVQAPIVWHQKAIGFRLFHSAAVRINSRGIRFIASENSLILGMLENTDSQPPGVTTATSMNQMMLLHHKTNLQNEYEAAQQKDAMHASRWRRIRCEASRDSLCAMKSSFADSSMVEGRFLPNFPMAVFSSTMRPPKDVCRMLSAMQEDALFCPEVSAGRTLGIETPNVDISLCNIMGVGADYLYVPSRNTLYVLLDPLNNISLFVVSVLVVYLMVVMGHNLQVVLGASETSASNKNSAGHWTVGAMLLIVVMSCCLMTSSHSMLNVYVTYEDSVAFVSLLVLVLYNCARVEADIWFGSGRRSNPVNPMLASIWLAVQRVYGSAENPYSVVLYFIMFTWSVHKASVLVHRMQFAVGESPNSWLWWRSLDLLVDFSVLSLLLFAGVIGQMQMETCNAALYVLQGLLAAMTLNRAVMPLHFVSLKSMHPT